MEKEYSIITYDTDNNQIIDNYTITACNKKDCIDWIENLLQLDNDITIIGRVERVTIDRSWNGIEYTKDNVKYIDTIE